MTQLQWQYLESILGDMSIADRDRLATLITETKAKDSGKEPSPTSAGKRPVYNPSNPSLGLFSDEPELIDEVMNYVYQSRANDPLRTRD